MAGTIYNINPYQYNFGCDSNWNPGGGRGVTNWTDSSNRTISPNGGYVTWIFTCTEPKCYSQQDMCCVSFDLEINSSTTSDDVGPIDITLNNTSIGTPCYHSKVAGHDTKIIIDLAYNDIYDDDGRNFFKITNNDTERSILIKNFKILRAYEMYNLDIEANGQCPDAVLHATYGTFDGTRTDYPCLATSGGRSFTRWEYPYDDISIAPGDYYGYSFTCQSTTNYVGPISCYANWDQIDISSDATADDVSFTLSLNGNTLRTDYHSKKKGHNIWPGVDLAQYSNYYNDRGQNTVVLTNTGSRTITVHDFDIYRIYQTGSPP